MGETISYSGGQVRCSCDAFQAMVREVERLQEKVRVLELPENEKTGMTVGISSDYHYRVAELKRENEGLRAEVEELNGIIGAMAGSWTPRVARRSQREERDG